MFENFYDSLILRENVSLNNDYIILDEGFKEIFNTIKNTPVYVTNFSKVKREVYEKYSLNIDKYLNKYKNDLAEIASLIKNADNTNERNAKLFEDNITKKFLLFLPKLYKELTDDLANSLQKIWDKFYKGLDDNEFLSKTFKSCLLTCIPMFFNSIFESILTPVLGQKKADLITSVCIGPFSEELCKLTSEKFIGRSKHGISYYNVVFNIVEFTIYFSEGYKKSIELIPNVNKTKVAKKLISVRAPGVLFHTVLNRLIKIGMDKDKELGGETVTTLTILMHACYNALNFKSVKIKVSDYQN